MKTLLLLMVLAGMLALAACDQPAPGCYPISGKPCSPDDPVHDLSPGGVMPV